MEALLEARHISKTFARLKALDDVNVVLESGKVTALIGENGAGKSTFLKIMSGIYSDYEGEIVFKGKGVRFKSPKDAQDQGISIIHQELNLIPFLTVSENIFLAKERVDRLGFLDKRAMRRKTQEILQKLQLDISPDTVVGSLKIGQQQIVEIAKALNMDCEVIFMDEPTSAIGDSEVEVLFQLIEQLKAEGKAIVYISHKLDELYAIADYFFVLRDGKRVAEGEMKDIQREELINLMAGRELQLSKKFDSQAAEEVVLKIEGLSLDSAYIGSPKLLHDINFSLRKGEVLGIYGLMGAGRTELFKSLFGLYPKKLKASIEIDGQACHFSSPAEAIRMGMALLPENRKEEGIFPNMGVAQNMSIIALGNEWNRGFLSREEEINLYENYVEKLGIKVQSATQLIKFLSGGNQQKVVLARWIACGPKILMLDEPSRGIDVNAKNEIYELINSLAKSGISIMIASSEIPEILAISDRILVMAEGRIRAEFSSEEANEHDIMKACIPLSTFL